MVTKYLDLTPEQKQRIEPINESFRTDQLEGCQQMQKARNQLLDVLKRQHPEKADIDAALADLSRIQAKQQRRAAEHILELKPVLTLEQQKKLFDLVEQKFCGQGRFGAGVYPGAGKPGCNGRSGCM